MLRLLFKTALALSLAVPALAQELTAPEERLISLFKTVRRQIISTTFATRPRLETGRTVSEAN